MPATLSNVVARSVGNEFPAVRRTVEKLADTTPNVGEAERWASLGLARPVITDTL